MTKKALKDLAEIKNYIERDSVYYANKTIADILRRTENLKLFPSMGRYVPEFNSKEMRELIYKSYRILYTFNSKNIYILRVIHHSRKISKLETKIY